MRHVLSFPISVQIFLTSSCNLSCSHCFSRAFSAVGQGESELVTEEWCSLISEFRKQGVLEIALSGGELFIRKDALKIIGHASQCGFPKGIRITTNGTLITRDAALALRTLGIAKVSVSIDGDEATHDYIRGRPGARKSAARGAQMLVEQKVPTMFQFTLMKRNWKSFEPVVGLAANLGVPEIHVNRLFCQGGCTRELYRAMALDKDESRAFTEEVSSIGKRFPSVKIDHNPLCFEQFTAENQKRGNVFNEFCCGAGYSSCSITPTGWVLACGQLSQIEAGNVRTQKFASIWRDSKELKAVRALSAISMSQIPFCRDCSYSDRCSGGCRANALSFFRDLLAPDPNCPFSDRFVPSQEKERAGAELGPF